MPSRREGVRRHFDRAAKRWNALYATRNPLKQALNHMLRPGLFQRKRLVFEHCGPIEGATVLDVGCGTGEYSIECAKRGAARVMGIDFAPSMVEFSRAEAQREGVADRCEFLCADLLTFDPPQRFDIVLAVGVLDYIRTPLPVLERIAGLTGGRFLGSFPVNRGLWKLQRALRYSVLKRCPIHEYTPGQVTGLFRKLPFVSVRFIPFTRGLLVVASKDLPR